MKTQKSIAIILFLAIFSNCGSSSFATELKIALAASAPLVNSLNLGANKAAVIQDFSDLASGAATLAEDFKATNDKGKKLEAVDRFEQLFESVVSRGHFKLSPRLQMIEGIVRGIIASGKIYYGTSKDVGHQVTLADIDAQIKALKAQMKP